MSKERIPDGWTLGAFPETFAGTAGPFYFEKEARRVGFWSTPRHANLGEVVHGGALLTLADMALFSICRDHIGERGAVTVSLQSEFLRSAPIGAFITAGGETTRTGKGLLFARGLVEVEGRDVLAFSGILKRLG